ncbi:Asp-tRNA(Asn)/Glu-tRNA(Gln) amidotransferase subunit GatC [Candidatus Fokinia solitaria]|nr:Asp-tRNA(Asn)/Glu-tRNA(Gln) amidotransferase subunit GatC [Candidatus Fokinia solitaria]
MEPQEIASVAEKLKTVIDALDKIAEVDTTGVEPMYNVCTELKKESHYALHDKNDVVDVSLYSGNKHKGYFAVLSKIMPS